MKEREIRRAQPWLGTLVDIAARGVEADQAVTEAFRIIALVHRLMSYHEPDSDVTRINREGTLEPVAVHPWTWQVLARARALSEASGGLFDITVAPTLTRLGYLPRHPDLPRCSGQGDWRHVELLPGHRVRLTRRLRIDLGGIAKGFAVDRAVAVLEAHRVREGRVNAGGDLRVFGKRPQAVHLRHPAHPTRLVPVAMARTAAVATSAGYFAGRRMRGRRVSPHVDPRTREALPPMRSVTVFAPECVTADALTKVVLLDPDHTQSVLDRFGAEAVVLEYRESSQGWQLRTGAHHV